MAIVWNPNAPRRITKGDKGGIGGRERNRGWPTEKCKLDYIFFKQLYTDLIDLHPTWPHIIRLWNVHTCGSASNAHRLSPRMNFTVFLHTLNTTKSKHPISMHWSAFCESLSHHGNKLFRNSNKVRGNTRHQWITKEIRKEPVRKAPTMAYLLNKELHYFKNRHVIFLYFPNTAREEWSPKELRCTHNPIETRHSLARLRSYIIYFPIRNVESITSQEYSNYS